MENLKIEELLIRVDRSAPGRLRLDWTGLSSLANTERIGPFFAQVLAEARQSGCSVEMHFETLAHFNSMTITTLIRLIHSARKATVPLRIHYDAKLRWQALSFEALARAAQSFASGGGPNVEFFSAPA